MLFNRLAGTAVRMQAAPHTAPQELASYRARLHAVVQLHTARGKGPTRQDRAYPSAGLQAVLKAWLAPGSSAPSGPPPPPPAPAPPPPPPTAQCPGVRYGTCPHDPNLVGSATAATWHVSSSAHFVQFFSEPQRALYSKTTGDGAVFVFVHKRAHARTT